MRRTALLLLAPLLLILAGASTAVRADDFAVPPLTGRVVDAAGVIGAAAEAALDARLAALEAQAGDQLVVATVPDLAGRPIEEVANTVFRTWELGQKDENNGLLLLVAPTERKVRIEVGYGLEGVVTDLVARMIIEVDILPRFKAGDLESGIAAGVAALEAALTGDPAELKERAALYEAQKQKDERFGLILFAVFVAFIIALIVLRKLADMIWPERKAARIARWIARDRERGGRRSRSSFGSSDRRFRGGGGSSGGGGASGSW